MCSWLKQLCILLAKNFHKKNNSFLYTSCEITGPLIYAAMVYNVLGHREVANRDPPTSINFDEYGGHNKSYILGYAPANDITDELMYRAARLANQKYNTELEAIGFDSEHQMMRFVNKNPQGIHSVYAFDNMTSQSKQLPERLHLILRPIIDSKERNDIPEEFTYDLHTMQVIMESYIYQQTGREHKLNVTWSNKSKLKNLPQSTSELIQTLSVLYSLLLGFLFCRNIYCMAQERESGVLKLLSKTGVNMYIYWLSWFMTVFVIIWPASLVIGAMMFVEHAKTPPPFVKSDIYAVLIYFTLFAVACTLYCIMGSVICQKANTACIISTCFFLGSSFPLQILIGKNIGVFFACFLINKNVHLTLVTIYQNESKGIGFSFSSNHILIPYISISFCGLVYAMVARILFNCVINHRPIWMILPQWKYQKQSRSFRDSYQTMVMSEDSLSHLKSGVIIDKLCANVPAPLGEINFTIYQNLVTVITDLDGNSSTTFLSILTGENEPLKGSVLVRNLDIVKNIAEIKQQTSLCPKEQTALFNSFTVLENLEFFHEVNFATGPHFLTVHFIDTEERNGNWHHVIRERKNFERRILELEPILTPVLGTSHRAKVLEHRNKSKTTVKDPKMT